MTPSREKLSTKEQIRLIKLSREKGFNPSNLSDLQYKTLAIASRITAPRALVRDAYEAGSSLVRVKYLGERVPLPIYKEREGKCSSNKCGNFIILKDGSPACNICNCSNNMLRIKWKDPIQSCVATPAAKDAALFYWTNYTLDDAIRDGYLSPEGERLDPSLFKY